MATYNKFQSFVEYLAEGVCNFQTDQLTVALTTNANAPSASLDLVLTDIIEIAYTNLSARDITTSSSSQTGGTYSYVPTDLTLNATGAVATFRWVVIYDNTPTSPADPLIAYFDYGADVTLASGESFTLDFGTELFTIV